MERQYALETVDGVSVVQVYADGFERLPLESKIFSYYLYQAAIAARDIAIDQHHRNALEVRQLLESIVSTPSLDAGVMAKILKYLKLFWISNGMYDSYSSKKYVLECSPIELKAAAESTMQRMGTTDATALGARAGETLSDFLLRLEPLMFDAAFKPIMTCKTPGADWVRESAVNFYAPGLTLAEVEQWEKTHHSGEPGPHALNSTIVRNPITGELEEEVWRAGLDPQKLSPNSTTEQHGEVPAGKYANYLEASIHYLEKALPYAPAGTAQQKSIRKLIYFLRTGAEDDFRAFNMQWVSDGAGRLVDFIHGFIEVYLDPRGQKGEWESCIYFCDPETSAALSKIGEYAQYFEDHMPWDPRYRKSNARPLDVNVVTVLLGTGGAGPCSPIGINLPNEHTIREQFGSKSIVLQNISAAADAASGAALVREFAADHDEVDTYLRCGAAADRLFTALHEVLGHASGRCVVSDPAAALPGIYSTLEETRADLVAMWHIWDDKLVEIGIMPHDRSLARAAYDAEIRNALLLQLRRVRPPADTLEEDHMKNRQLIANWLLRHADGAVERRATPKGTAFKVVDYAKARAAVGTLLAEVMRIKAEGDTAAGKRLVDTYGWKIDTELRDEVTRRIAASPEIMATGAGAMYHAFVMPELVAKEHNGRIVDIDVVYPRDLTAQMLRFSAYGRQLREQATGSP